MLRRTLIPMIAAVLLQGCIVKETTHTLYLEPDGSLTWMVLEHAVRSDAGTAEDRAREEAGFLAAFEAEEHQAAEALRALRPWALESRMLRDRRPYTILTTARFSDPSVVLQDLMDLTGIRSSAVLERDGDSMRLVIAFPLDDEGDPITFELPDEGMVHICLLDAFLEWEFRLSEGRFLDTEGFEVTNGRAVPLNPDEDFETEPGGEIRYVLAWSVEED